MKLFVDTSFIISLAFENDENNGKAVELKEVLSEECYINNSIVNEVAEKAKTFDSFCIESTKIEEKYNIKDFYQTTKGYENEPEKGKRCEICFNLRLLKTAEFAYKNNVSIFTTTLSVSPHKNSKQIFEQGKICAQKFNVEFLEYDFKKQDGFKISRQIARENNMYAQNYCGCEFSIRK